jgi:hypothetical protein
MNTIKTVLTTTILALFLANCVQLDCIVNCKENMCSSVNTRCLQSIASKCSVYQTNFNFFYQTKILSTSCSNKSYNSIKTTRPNRDSYLVPLCRPRDEDLIVSLSVLTTCYFPFYYYCLIHHEHDKNSTHNHHSRTIFGKLCPVRFYCQLQNCRSK